MVIKVRFMRVEEIDRVYQLLVALQDYQKLDIRRMPTKEEFQNEVMHKDLESGSMLPNKFGIYTAVAIDETRLHEPGKAYIVGYIIYVQNFSLIEGKQIYLTSFFIEPNYRRQGVGKKLMEFLRVHSLSTGNKRVDVPYMNNNLIGHKFYATYGSYDVNEEYLLLAYRPDRC